MSSESQDPASGLVPAGSNGGNVPSVVDEGMEVLTRMLGEAAGLVVHNFDGTKDDQWRLESLAVNGDCLGKDDIGNEVLSVKYAYLHSIIIPGNTSGEMIDAVRTVLITDDFKAYAFVSAGVAMAVYRMFVQFGRQAFDPPQKVRVVSKKTRKGFKITTLVPVFA